MKLCLGMMVHDDLNYLELHLPTMADCFDGIVAVVETEQEARDVHELFRLRSTGDFWGKWVIVKQFNNDWSEMFNHVIYKAEQLKFDAILRLDPDEVMFPHDIDKVRQMLVQYDLLYLSRVNFWMDRLHYSPQYGNDYQGRAWRLNECIRLGGKHHESPRGVGNKHPILTEQLPDVAIYHYGDVGRERILKRDLHYLNVAREQAGHPPLTERPADREFPTRENVVYNGKQPLDPYKVGIYAPFTE